MELNEHANTKVKELGNGVEDFEIEAEISFILKTDDPDYDEDEDNILFELSYSGAVKDHLIGCPAEDAHRKELWDFGLGDKNNHNEFSIKAIFHDEHPMSGEYHCYIFHELYDHSRLMGWGDILRIGGFWTDVKVFYQTETYL